MKLNFRKFKIFSLWFTAGVVGIFILCIVILPLVLVVTLHQSITVPVSKVYEIPGGMTSHDVARDLFEKKIISSPRIFEWYVFLKKLDTKLQSGKYEFPRDSMNVRELVSLLTAGARAQEIQFTIPEGYTVREIAEVLSERGLDKEGEFIELAESGTLKLEGYLFPDTYRVFQGATGGAIVQKMRDNFQIKISPLTDEIKKQGETVEEVVIVASILEKEVRTEEDMRIVSDILWRRLAVNKALEVDATLNYILDVKKPSLTYSDLEIDSPYNTYKYQGLPPTPIGNPGIKAITAALYPTPNDYWYYLSKPDGETIFSKTFAEHVKNKQKYLQ